MFFLSDDEKFLIKTTRKNEMKTLIDLLPAYYRHMEANPGSLVTRFYGVHGVKMVGSRLWDCVAVPQSKTGPGLWL
jgi:1-phosphatidylinositol-4-phosphate 5-kinase